MTKQEPYLRRAWNRILDLSKRFWAILCLPRVRRTLLAVVSFLLATAFLVAAFCFIISTALCKKVETRIKTPEQAMGAEEKYDLILVLGCRVHADGTPSQMLDDRVTVATRLYLGGAADSILMSGDSQTPYYNEVDPMKELSVELGADPDSVFTDPYGLSTYESIVRLLEDCKGKRILIVTQEYHLYRALYIAEKLGLEADGVAADLRPYEKQLLWSFREVFARCKDVFLCAARN